MARIIVTINGETRELDEPLTVADLLRQYSLHERTVAVEYNGEIILHGRYFETNIGDGDKLEIVQMMAGG